MSYTGSKGGAGVAETIIGQMPRHDTYVECFVGSGEIWKRKTPATKSILVDINPQVTARFEITPSVQVLTCDALGFLEHHVFFPDWVVYCDPPYLLSTRNGRRYYQNEMFQFEHARLLTLLKGLKCRVLLSGYPSDLYSSQLQDWRCVKYRARFHRKTTTECLWCNFAEPGQLHDWRYAGKNHRERVVFKRLAARLIGRLDAMPARKRGFLLQAIKARYELPA